MIRLRTVALVLAVAAAVTSCSPETPVATVTPSPQPTVPVMSEDLHAAGLTEPAPPTGTDDTLGVVPCDAVTTDRYGTYTPTCLRDDAPVLQFDPAGAWSWLVRPGAEPMALDPGYVAWAVDQAGRLLVDLIDSTAQWDDSPEAWSGIGSRFGGLLGRGPGELRASVVSGPGVVGMFDAEDWRESAGIRPAPYVDGVPRIRVHDLRLTRMSFRHVGPATRDSIGVAVTVRARFTQPVVTSDGSTWALEQWVTLDVSSLESTREVQGIDWSENKVLGLRLAGGQESLPVLEVEPGTPSGWSPQTHGALTYALPAGAVLDEQSADDATVPWKRFALETGDPAPRLEISGPHPDADSAPEGDWYVVPGFANYGLDIPGAEHAAAEIGTDDQQRFRARIFVGSFEHGSTQGYTVEWDTTPDRAEDELRQVAASMSVEPLA